MWPSPVISHPTFEVDPRVFDPVSWQLSVYNLGAINKSIVTVRPGVFKAFLGSCQILSTHFHEVTISL